MRKDAMAALDSAEMAKKLTEMEEESFHLRFKMSMGQTEGLKKIRENRKQRARLLTYLRDRELKGAAK